ncbi:hypothetical protein SAMN05443144_101135 [Fodinibius roseus]|uniref:Mth938-like domain-containing protein n=1 Tax=Fodinibius roseus TaxID=1194090 RepID=A0A1M4SVR1_9BACT|nr:MTH938/NDUFAF3 family protein [Fodinibius roseus]SHE36281.1 hypothetical protein SAMN05443144_101135 [Fodinibius roseus]
MMMNSKNISPKINSIEWGEISISEGQHYKDAKLYPGGSREWDWNETGTHHSPGIQPADIRELLEQGAEVVVLSKGFNERLKTSQQAETFLKQHAVPYHILQTEAAVAKYNKLRETKPAGALIHSTC